MRMECLAKRRRRRRGLTVLELLVTVGVIGLLMSLILPAVLRAREASRRLQCSNHLRQIGLAMQLHHQQHRRLPPSWKVSSAGPYGYGWAVPLTPFLDQAGLAERLREADSWDDPAARDVRQASWPVMLCPSDIVTPSFQLYQLENDEPYSPSSASREPSEKLAVLAELPTANYVGVYGTVEPDDEFPAPPGDGPLVADQAVRFADLERGLSNTLLVGERTMAAVPSTWYGVDFRGEDAACRLVGAALAAPNCRHCDECEFQSRHPGGVNFVRADGHVSFMLQDIDPQAYRQLTMRSAAAGSPSAETGGPSPAEPPRHWRTSR